MPDVKLWNGAVLKSLRRVLAKGTNATFLMLTILLSTI